MIAIRNDELNDAPEMDDTFICSKCGETHPVEYGKIKLEDGTWADSKMLGFYKCDGKLYLCSLKGKDIRRS